MHRFEVCGYRENQGGGGGGTMIVKMVTHFDTTVVRIRVI